MTWLVILAFWCALASGIYLMLSRDLLRCLFGIMLMSTAINILVFMSGRVGNVLPPIITGGQQALSGLAANPVPQALVLTAIVIGFSLTCFSMLLGVIVLRNGASVDVDAIRDAEPPETDPVKPPYSPDALDPWPLKKAEAGTHMQAARTKAADKATNKA